MMRLCLHLLHRDLTFNDEVADGGQGHTKYIQRLRCVESELYIPYNLFPSNFYLTKD
jgi:hypothetical protein